MMISCGLSSEKVDAYLHRAGHIHPELPMFATKV